MTALGTVSGSWMEVTRGERSVLCRRGGGSSWLLQWFASKMLTRRMDKAERTMVARCGLDVNQMLIRAGISKIDQMLTGPDDQYLAAYQNLSVIDRSKRLRRCLGR
jgi:hypothetical protein